MAVYKVIDVLSKEIQEFEDIVEANKETIKIEGKLIKIDDDGTEKELRDLSGF